MGDVFLLRDEVAVESRKLDSLQVSKIIAFFGLARHLEAQRDPATQQWAFQISAQFETFFNEAAKKAAQTSVEGAQKHALRQANGKTSEATDEAYEDSVFDGLSKQTALAMLLYLVSTSENVTRHGEKVRVNFGVAPSYVVLPQAKVG